MKKMTLQLNSHDITWICLLVILMTALLVANRIVFAANGVRYANVYIYGEAYYSLPLNQTTTLTLKQTDYLKPGSTTDYALLGDVTIEVKNEQVRVEKEESPRHICSLQGWVGTTGLPIICAPNNLMIVIEEEPKV